VHALTLTLAYSSRRACVEQGLVCAEQGLVCVEQVCVG